MIGTMTFHWATNYGAVLQAYALQKWLTINGYETEILNYIPLRELTKDVLVKIRDREFSELIKAAKLERFRKENLKLSRPYYSNKQMKTASMCYDSLITGSDQIWNQYFTLHGESGGANLSYFLDFAAKYVNRVGYAVSFGATSVSNEYIELVRSEVKQFSNISVRESSGIDIVRELGMSAQLVCDPTVLLEKRYYIQFMKKTGEHCSKVFEYTLHSNVDCSRVAHFVRGIYGDGRSPKVIPYSLEQWLWKIYTAEIVVTNSFHGIMLSLILNIPFIAVLIQKTGMNDRLITLLNYVGLESRIVDRYDEDVLRELTCSSIDWDKVNERIDQMRFIGEQFLYGALGGKKVQ